VNTARELIRGLAGRGISVAIEGDDLRVKAPRGALTAADRATLLGRKAEVLDLLRAGEAPVRRHGRARGPGPRAATCPTDASRPEVPAAAELGPPEGLPAWDGEGLGGETIGFDTETAVVEGVEVPTLALASASAGGQHRLVHPDRLGAFLLRHRDRHFVVHNAAFDFWVVARQLEGRGEREALAAWRRIVDEGRLHDTMLLDQLIRLAESDAHPMPRDLGVVAREYAGVEVDKSDPYRRRYGEILGRDWAGVERGFFTYAIGDPIATLAAFEVMHPRATRLMEDNGHEPTRRE
jgi:hypothetical protein